MKIKLLLDESFVDFVDSEADCSLLHNEVLESYEGLYIMKSISKSYGVPGLRLGVLASGNLDMIAKLKKEVSIWNINSFAEFYMQIYEKYDRDYKVAMDRFRIERQRFVSELGHVSSLRVIPSQANYVMCEVLGGMSAAALAQTLLARHDILIKDLTPEVKRGNRQLVRLAIRNDVDNMKLISALKQVLS